LVLGCVPLDQTRLIARENLVAAVTCVAYRPLATGVPG
jgi:hypothetical protein